MWNMGVKRIVTTPLLALVLAGCFGEADEPPIVIECFEFEGEEICGPALSPASMQFDWVPEEIGGKTVRFSERDSARFGLPQTIEIVANENTGRSIAIVERGPVSSRMCLKDGVFVGDPETGLGAQIIAPGDCGNLNGVALVTEQKRRSCVSEGPEFAGFGGFDGV